MKTILFSLFAMLLITSTSYAQNSADTLSQKKHFRIASFVVDGRKISDIQVIFLLNGQEIIPQNVDGIIYVPDEMLEASWEKSGIRFKAPNIDFSLNNILFKGYLDSDNVTSDYIITVDTIPLEIEAKHVSQLSKKEKRSLGIRSYKDVCSVFTLTGDIVIKNPNPNLIVDPLTTKQFNFCKRKN